MSRPASDPFQRSSVSVRDGRQIYQYLNRWEIVFADRGPNVTGLPIAIAIYKML